MNSQKTNHSDKAVREKLAARGVVALSDGELLSIVIEEGVQGESALELAQRVLDSAGGSVLKLSQTGLIGLRQCNGLGVRRSAQVLCAIELGRRAERENGQAIETITCNEDIVEMFRPTIGSLPYEEFWVVYLTTSNRVLDKVRVGQGGISGVVVDTRLVVKRAIELLASAIIVVHNHPSGKPQPSTQDVELTKKLAAATSLFEIELHDHIIICINESLSFRFLGLI